MAGSTTTDTKRAVRRYILVNNQPRAEPDRARWSEWVLPHLLRLLWTTGPTWEVSIFFLAWDRTVRDSPWCAFSSV
jgi:hypothetical protein